MAHTIVQDRRSKEVLYSWSDPLGVGHDAHGGPCHHIYKSEYGKQKSCLLFGDISTLAEITEENERGEEAEEHDEVAHEIQQEAAVLEQGEVDEAVHDL